MQLREFGIGLLVTGVLVCLNIGAAGAGGANFTADMVSHMGKQTTSAKIYASGEKTRMEMEGNVVITRLDKNVSWVIMPADKMYMEHPIMKAKQPQTTKEMPGEVSRESLGKETVNGQDTEKFKVTYTEEGKTQVVYQWLKDGVLPVKI